PTGAAPVDAQPGPRRRPLWPWAAVAAVAAVAVLVGAGVLLYPRLMAPPQPAAMPAVSRLDAEAAAPTPDAAEDEEDDEAPPDPAPPAPHGAAKSPVFPSPSAVQPAHEAPPAPRPVRREALLRSLSGAEIQATVRRYQADIARCLRNIDTQSAPSKVDAQITIDNTGRVTQVTVSPPVGQSTVDRCLSRSLKAMRFHRHPAPEIKVTIPLKIKVL
ncbi:MAG: AgmX/PglI C-terminal domain-containing protein, partial [Deltaproteobacteria bacterium]